MWLLSNEKRKNAINRQQLTKIHSEKFPQWILRKIAIEAVLSRLTSYDNWMKGLEMGDFSLFSESLTDCSQLPAESVLDFDLPQKILKSLWDGVWKKVYPALR